MLPHRHRTYRQSLPLRLNGPALYSRGHNAAKARLLLSHTAGKSPSRHATSSGQATRENWRPKNITAVVAVAVTVAPTSFGRAFDCSGPRLCHLPQCCVLDYFPAQGGIVVVGATIGGGKRTPRKRPAVPDGGGTAASSSAADQRRTPLGRGYACGAHQSSEP